MKLNQALKNKEEKILSLWVERTLDSYISSGFFKRSTDKFANPVGANIKEGLTRLFRHLVKGDEQQQYVEPLDQVIRIRAVQEFTPAQAVAPIFELKWVVKQVFSADKEYKPLLPELDTFDCDVDRAGLVAFDMYVQCRDRLHKARIREIKSGSFVMTDSACASAMIKDNLQQITDLS